MNVPSLFGKRAVLWLLASKLEQSDTSIPDQERVARAFAQRHGIEIVHRLELAGVSGSNPMTAINGVEHLLRVRDNGKAFDIVLLHDLSRFTRAGPQEQAVAKSKLSKHGIRIVEAANHTPRTQHSQIQDSLNAFTNQDAAVRISSATTRGQQQQLHLQRRPHCSRPPYGTDRLISDPSGVPLYKLRAYPSGAITKVDPNTGEEYEPIHPQKGERAHEVPDQYLLTLVPSLDARVRTIREIFKRRDHDGWGPHRIAAALNHAGVEAPDPGGWSKGTVKYLLENTIYCGVGYTNRKSRARYHKRGKDEVVAFDNENNPRRMTPSGNYEIEYRPEDDWVRVDYPALRHLLDEDLRERVLERQMAHLRRESTRERRPSKHKHADSPYLLTGILRTANGVEMRGRKRGRSPSQYRYYIETAARNRPVGGSRAKGIRADVIESILLHAVIDMLRGLIAFEDRIVDETFVWVRSLGDADARAEAERELALVEKKQIRLINASDDFVGPVFDDQAMRLKEQKAALNQRLDQMTEVPFQEDRIREVVQALLAGLFRSAEVLPTMPNAIKKRALRCFVESAVFDQERNEVSFCLRLPSWAQQQSGLLGLEDSLGSETIPEAQPFLRIHYCLEVPKAPRRKAS